MRRIPTILLFAALALLLLVPSALAAGPPPQPVTQLLTPTQLACVVIGILTPVVGYVVNTAVFKKAVKKIPEPIAGLVHVILAAAGAAIYTAIQRGSIGFDAQTLQLIVTSIIAAFFAHGFIWKPTGVQARLAAVSPETPHRRR